MNILTYHPFKGAYALAALGFELLRLPIWLIKYITPYGRQHKTWTFRQALSIRLFSSAVYHIARLQLKTPLPLAPGKEAERFVVIPSADGKFYTGPLAPNEYVKPEKVGSSWYPAPLTPSSDTRKLTVVLHLHGGAYVLGDGRTEASGYFVSKLLKHAGATHVFAPQYRLSTLPASATSNPFPAALQDCLTAYLYLVNTLNISPENIVLSGDSAGANAAIALLRYISEFGASLNIPNPSAAWLWSPWVQPRDSITAALTQNINYSTDYLSYPFTQWGGYAYAGFSGPEILNSEYISAMEKPFKTEVPLWVHTGDAEVLYFEDVRFVDFMKKAGNKVDLEVEPGAPHDILLVGGQLGFDGSATRGARAAGMWLGRVLERK